MRRILALGAAVLAAGCGATRPAPTLDDYAHGVSTPVGEIAEYFFEKEMGRGGPAVAPAALGNGEGAGSLAELSRRWRGSCAARCTSAFRIIDLQKKSSSDLAVRLEVRLEGLSAPGNPERVAVLAAFDLDFRRPSDAAAWTLLASRAVGGPAAIQHGRPHLFEEAAARGLVAVHDPVDPIERTNLCVPATHHQAGILLADVDGDGSVDVIVPNRRPKLFLNDGTGHFRDATAGSGLDLLPDMEAAGAVAADLDGDGLPELFLSNHVSPSRLLKNLGHGKFRDVTAEWGLAGLSAPFTSAVFFDADGDGRVDLFVGCYGDARTTGPAYDGLNGLGDRFFRNVGRDGHPFFVDETAVSGLGDTGWALAASVCDVDDDGRDDLYVANDFGKHAFFQNRSTPGHPRFVNVAKEAGVEDEGYGMGVAWGDFDGDGRWDLHVSDYWTPYRWILHDARWPMPALPGAFLARPFMAKKMFRRSRGDGLFRNLGGMKFERVSEQAGVADGGWAWGAEFADLDGKGREDLVVVNGMFRATTGVDDEVGFWNAMGREGVNFHDGIWGGIDFGVNGMASRTPKKLFWNRGDGTFDERAYVEGFDTRDDTRGLAYADLDGDGAPEIVLSCFRGPVLLYANRWKGAGGGRLVLRLSTPTGFNRDALGAVVRLWAGGRVQLREVRAGSSYLSQSSHDLLFGLGTNEKADRIEIRWPDGKRQEIHDVPAGVLVTLAEGEEEKRDLLGR
ncbi:MAG TPA: CRTAC1 family protein [Thermoanaerobaculia bacterium]|nr:CRTAC1 family protein [Thermoanaerobaculia bacterium]